METSRERYQARKEGDKAMTSDLTRALEMVADAIERNAAKQSFAGATGFLVNPTLVNWPGVISDLRRSSARSAGAGREAKQDASRVPAMAMLCPHDQGTYAWDGDGIGRSGERCKRCGAFIDPTPETAPAGAVGETSCGDSWHNWDGWRFPCPSCGFSWPKARPFPETAAGPAVPESGLGEPKLAYDKTSDLRAVVREHFGVTETEPERADDGRTAAIADGGTAHSQQGTPQGKNADPSSAPSAPYGELRAIKATLFGEAHVYLMTERDDVYRVGVSVEGWPVVECYQMKCQSWPREIVEEHNRVMARRPVPLGETAGADHSQLMKFYSVTTVDALIEAQARHVERLQERLPPSPYAQFPGSPRHG